MFVHAALMCACVSRARRRFLPGFRHRLRESDQRLADVVRQRLHVQLQQLHLHTDRCRLSELQNGPCTCADARRWCEPNADAGRHSDAGAAGSCELRLVDRMPAESSKLVLNYGWLLWQYDSVVQMLLVKYVFRGADIGVRRHSSLVAAALSAQTAQSVLRALRAFRARQRHHQ